MPQRILMAFAALPNLMWEGIGLACSGLAGVLSFAIHNVPDTPAPAANLLGWAAIAGSVGSTVVALAKIFKDSSSQKIAYQVETLTAQLVDSEAKAEKGRADADKGRKAAEEKAERAIAAAKHAARQVAELASENRQLTREVMGKLGQSHELTRKTIVSEIKDVATRPRILIIDDDRDLCRMLRKWFTVNGFEADYALSIAEAENKLHPRLVWIFLDWNLPDGKGEDLLIRLKKQGHGAKIIIITGQATDDVRTKSYRAYAEMVIAKPMDDEFLANLLIDMRATEEMAPRPHLSDVDLPTMTDSGSGIIPTVPKG